MNKRIATNMLQCSRSVKVGLRSRRRTTAREGAKLLKLKLLLLLLLLLLPDDKPLPPLAPLQPPL
jgi:hypothetical protein